jgi:hypothetical protein
MQQQCGLTHLLTLILTPSSVSRRRQLSQHLSGNAQKQSPAQLLLLLQQLLKPTPVLSPLLPQQQQQQALQTLARWLLVCP